MSKSPDPKALQHMTDPKAFQQVTDPKTRRQSSPPAGLVLAFDTAGETIALAVGRWSDGASILPLAADDHPAARQANVQLMPSVDTLFTEHSLAKSEITCMVCGLGPGSFTGVRIGVATAKGLARGLRVPLFGISTLDAIAWGAWLAGIRGTLGVIADAMRGEVYPLRFLLSDEGVVRLDPYTVAKAGDVAARWREAGEILLLVGDGLGKYAEVFEGQDFPFILGDATLWTPTGIGLLRAFEAAWVQGTLDSGEAGTLLPIYTRLSDAEENERRRLASGGPIVQGAAVEVPLSGVADPARAGAVVFRPMAAVDLDQVDVIEKAAFPGGAATSKERWTRAQLADDLTRTDRVWWVACVGDLLVGFAGGWVTGGELQVLDVAVDESRRRCGIAYKLLERLLQDAFNLGATTASLEVRESNKAARALYASLGFEQIGIRPSYYAPRESGSSREDAVILSLPLGPGGRGKCPTRLRRDRGTYNLSRNCVTDYTSPCHAACFPVSPCILAVETSCDETAVAIIDGEGHLLSDVVASQVDFHARFGGVVPEIASRKHTEAIVGVVDAALDEAGFDSWQELDALAVTYAPGLIGALVVGVAFAKGLSWATGLPLIRVNHLEGHIYANRMGSEAAAPQPAEQGSEAAAPQPAEQGSEAAAPQPAEQGDEVAGVTLSKRTLSPPFVIALLSGGHTMLVHVSEWGEYRILGQTLDDAVGEAFDKIAKALGLGYPGGSVISRLAEQGNPQALDFPRALLHSHDYRFSLSGLKTAVITFIKKEQEARRELNLPDIAASFQQAVIDVQVAKALAALEETGCTTFCIGGGVAANKALRVAYEKVMAARGIHVVFPPHNACTDNASMIARVALDRFRNGSFMRLDDDAFAQADLELKY